MNRAFLTLYSAVVVFIAIMGFVLDKFWQSYQPLPSLTPLETELIHYLAKQPVEVIQQWESEFISAQSFALDSLADSSLASSIRRGEMVSLFNQQGEKLIYLRTQENTVLELKVVPQRQASSDLHILLLLMFYLLMAVVIFIWIWPLSRDLKGLRRQMRSLGEDGVPQTVSVPSNSFVRDLPWPLIVCANVFVISWPPTKR